ncbi:MAG: hypothetical protein KF727_07170 [Microbacteriaceae bacterium]|nr:hypothetical protein [Microbacteriaceae bacterium]
MSLLGLVLWAIFFWPTDGDAWAEAMSTAIPTWLASLGGAAALLAVFVTNVRTRQVEKSTADIAEVQDAATRPRSAEVVWDVEATEKKGRSLLVNRGSRRAENVVIVDLTKEQDGHSGFSVMGDVPDFVDVNDSIRVGMDRSLADPYISRIKISWTEDGEAYEAFYSIMTALTEIPQFCSSKFPTPGRSAA